MELLENIAAKFNKGESVTLLCPPLVAKQPIIKALLKQAKELKRKIEVVDLRNLEQLSTKNFLSLLPPNLKNKTLIIVDCDLLLPLGTPPFLKMALISEKYQTNFLFLFSQNILSERLRIRLYKIPLLFENIYHFPLNSQNLPFSNQALAENFLACLEESQREALRLLLRNLPIKNQNWLSETEYLKNIGLVKKTKGGFRTISSLIDHAALKLPEIATETFQIKGKRILIGRNDISKSFSPAQQKVLVLLLQKRNKIVNRESIAESLWGKDYLEHYSDWAIDQLIFKLRRKLEKVWINPKIIKTAKKKGLYLKS